MAHSATAPSAPARPRGWRLRAALALLVAVTAIAAAQLGLLRPLDNGLADWRFAQTNRPPTGSVVLVEIDPASLRRVGVWPWPRRVYAELLDKLMALGATDTAFDIDFSSASDEADDTAFAAALGRAGGYAHLAAFRQLSATGGLELTLPLPRFLDEAEAVAANVVAEPDGIVRRYLSGMTIGHTYYPSLAESFSGRTLRPDEPFSIDYGIDTSSIDRVSVADILSDSVDPARIAGRQVIVAATAQELRDLFTVPRFGTIPGGLLQALGVESLKQGRALHAAGNLMPAAIVLALGLFFLLRPRQERLWREAVLAALCLLAVEGAGYAAQLYGGLLLHTTAIDLAIVGYLVAAVLAELEAKRRLHATAARERDAVRRILDQVIADNFDGVVVIDESRKVIAASAVAERLLGQGLSLAEGSLAAALPDGLDQPVERVLAESDEGSLDRRATGELTLAIGGERRALEYAVTRSVVALDGGLGRRVVCLTFRDISERRRHEERLAFLAAHDPLTGALSRLALVEAIETTLATERGRAEGLTVMIVDLGRFRAINDMFGHSFGDEVMKEVVCRLQGLEMMAVGRVGGDSFAVARRGALDSAEALSLGSGVVSRLAEPYLIGGRRAVLSARAGLTTSALSGHTGGVLLSHADMALSATKDMVGNAVEIFAPAMTVRLVEKQEMEQALRTALHERQFEVFYQPLVRLADRQIVGVEALLRWQHPTFGTISPGRFIPIAEETGLMVELGRDVLVTACREVAGWPGQLRLAVNVSPVQFELGDVLADVSAALAESGLPPARLELEITEGLFVDPGHPAGLALERLRSLGVGVALDDFGTGYSSLGYLSRLPADRIKIDRSFVMALPGDDDGKAVVSAVLAMAHTLGKEAVAEGIETEAQAALLLRLGCDLAQGYLFGKPMPAGELRDLLPRAPAERGSAVILHLAPRS